MSRDLLDIGQRRALVPPAAAAPPGGGGPPEGFNAFVTHAGNGPVEDPFFWILGQLWTANVIEWQLGDESANQNTNTLNYNYNAVGSFDVNYNIGAETDWKRIYGYWNYITGVTTQAAWTAMERYVFWTNCITSVETHPEWTAMLQFNVNDNELTELETHPEWTSMTLFHIYTNNISGTVNTYAAWVAMETFDVSFNNLNTVELHPEWTAMTFCRVRDNNLNASEIDNLLIAIDGAGASSGQLHYQNNPASADACRSAAANTAKANLVARSWTISI